MKKLIYFIEVCALCAVISTACTSNETKSEQEVTSIDEESIKNEARQEKKDVNENINADIEQEESNAAIQIKDKYFVINKENFRETFNIVANEIESLENLSEWEHQLNEFENHSEEGYVAYSSGTEIFLLKSLNNENFVNIFLRAIIESEEDLINAEMVAYLVAMICESNTAEYEPENFSENINMAFANAIDIGEKQSMKDPQDTIQFIKGENLTYCCTYDAKSKVSTFMVLLPI